MTVLIVEDEPLLREVLGEELVLEGLEVCEAANAEEALALAADIKALDLVVTDVNLGPGMTGLALADEAARRWPHTGVVIMTGNPANMEGLELSPTQRYVPKPFAVARLMAAIRDLMAVTGS